MIGDTLRAARIKRGLTQKELAVLVGKSKQTISNIEVGAVGLNLTLAMKLAEALKVKPSIFLPSKTRKSVLGGEKN